jgi:hypothetical protein
VVAQNAGAQHPSLLGELRVELLVTEGRSRGAQGRLSSRDHVLRVSEHLGWDTEHRLRDEEEVGEVQLLAAHDTLLGEFLENLPMTLYRNPQAILKCPVRTSLRNVFGDRSPDRRRDRNPIDLGHDLELLCLLRRESQTHGLAVHRVTSMS